MAFNVGNTAGWADVLFKSNADRREQETHTLDMADSWGKTFTRIEANKDLASNKLVSEIAAKVALGFGKAPETAAQTTVPTNSQFRQSTLDKFTAGANPQEQQATSGAEPSAPTMPATSAAPTDVNPPVTNASMPGTAPAPSQQTPQPVVQQGAPQQSAQDPRDPEPDTAQPSPREGGQPSAASPEQQQAVNQAVASAGTAQPPTAVSAQPPQAVQAAQPVAAQLPQVQAGPAQPQPQPQPGTGALPPTSAAPAAPQPTRLEAAQAQQREQYLQMAKLPANPVTGTFQLTSPDVVNAQVNAIKQLAQSGQIPYALAQQRVEMIGQAQQMKLKAGIEMQNKIAEYKEKDARTRKDLVEVADKGLKLQNDQYAVVMGMYKAGDTAGAQFMAQTLELPINFRDGKSIAGAWSRTKDAETYQKRQKSEGDLAETEAKTGKLIKETNTRKTETTGLPDGLYRYEGDSQAFMKGPKGQDIPMNGPEIAQYARDLKKENDLKPSERIKAIEDEGKIEDSMRSAQSGNAVIGKLRTLIDPNGDGSRKGGIYTGPIVGKEGSADGKLPTVGGTIAYFSTDRQQAVKLVQDLRRADAQLFGASPSDAEGKYLEKLNNVLVLDNPLERLAEMEAERTSLIEAKTKQLNAIRAVRGEGPVEQKNANTLPGRKPSGATPSRSELEAEARKRGLLK